MKAIKQGGRAKRQDDDNIHQAQVVAKSTRERAEKGKAAVANIRQAAEDGRRRRENFAVQLIGSSA